MENKNAQVRLTGQWRLSRKFTTNGSDERNLVLYNQPPEYIVGFPAEAIITERCGNDVSTVMYHYDPDTKVISIQQSNRSRPSPISGKTESLYRIIPLNDREMYFQSPHTVEDDSSDFEMILLERK